MGLIKRVKEITVERQAQAKKQSATLLPDRPSERGLTPSQLKQTLGYPLTFSIEEINRLATEVNAILDILDENVIANSSNRHSHNNKSLLDEYYREANEIDELFDVMHNHKNKEVLDSYSMNQQELTNFIGGDFPIVEERLREEIQQQGETLTKSHEEIYADLDSKYMELLSKIDSINATQNVIDMVGTYAELMTYDTSLVLNNDKIGVINDENNNGLFSYYKRDTTNDIWVLIGSTTVGLSKEEALELFAPKGQEVKLKTLNGKSLLGEGNLSTARTIKITSLDALTVVEQLAISQLVSEFYDGEKIVLENMGDIYLTYVSTEKADAIENIYYTLISVVDSYEIGDITLLFKRLDDAKSETIKLFSEDYGETWVINRVKTELDVYSKVESDNRYGTKTDSVDHGNRIKVIENSYIKSVEYEPGSGIFRFTMQDGTIKTMDLAIEKVVTNFEYGTDATITDLTGTTVTVPINWNAPAGYGKFHLEGIITINNGKRLMLGGEANNFEIGYGISYGYPTGYEEDDAINVVADGEILHINDTFNIEITGGTDVTNPALIQWVKNNNATFEGGVVTYNPSLKLTLADGTIQSIPLSDFITEYTGVENEQIQVSVQNGNKIEAILKDNSVTLTKINDEVKEHFASKEEVASQLGDINTILATLVEV